MARPLSWTGNPRRGAVQSGKSVRRSPSERCRLFRRTRIGPGRYDSRSAAGRPDL